MSTFVCDICEASYARRDGLQRHKKQKHRDQLEPEEKSAFSCSFCDKSYTMRKNLLKHCRQSHADESLESEHEEDEPVEKTAFACSFCDKSYTMRKNLLKHCRHSHPDESLESEHEEEAEENDGSSLKKSKVSCSHCSKAYSSMGNLSRHVKTEHPEFYDDPSQTLMDCPKCDSKFTRKTTMTKHLVDEHNYEDIHQELQFPTLDDFSKWKDQIEKQTLSSYVRPRGSSVVKAGTRIDYICHRSGVFHEKGTQGRHFHLRTRKCGYICPARLIVTISPDESINVMWHKNHFAHEVDIRFLRLTDAEREAIRAQVYEGRSFERILDDVREATVEQGQFSGLSVLQRRDLGNIMRGCDLSEADVCIQIDDHIETLCDTTPEVGHNTEAVEIPHIWAAVRSNLTFALTKCDETYDQTLLEMSFNLLGEIRKRLPPSTNAAMPSLPPLPSMTCTPNKESQQKENMRTPGSVSRLVPGASPLTPHNVNTKDTTQNPTACTSLPLY